MAACQMLDTVRSLKAPFKVKRTLSITNLPNKHILLSVARLYAQCTINIIWVMYVWVPSIYHFYWEMFSFPLPIRV